MQLLDSFVVCLSEDLVFLAVNACLLFFFSFLNLPFRFGDLRSYIVT